MPSSKDREIREREAEQHKQKFSLYTDFANATEATARIAHSDQIGNTGVSMGDPLVIQDTQGVLKWQPGLDAPVTPNS